MKLKYIILKYIMFDEDTPIIFPGTLNYDEFHITGKTPTSAGYVNIYSTQESGDSVCVHTYGESITLNLQSKEEDNEIIKKLLND
jgi:hypothetical protein